MAYTSPPFASYGRRHAAPASRVDVLGVRASDTGARARGSWGLRGFTRRVEIVGRPTSIDDQDRSRIEPADMSLDQQNSKEGNKITIMQGLGAEVKQQAAR